MTPTPWTLKQHAMNHHTLTGATAGLIADIHKDEDARLIAAAPDLLAALMGIEQAVRLYTDADRVGDWPELDAARAAIAKATEVQP